MFVDTISFDHIYFLLEFCQNNFLVQRFVYIDHTLKLLSSPETHKYIPCLQFNLIKMVKTIVSAINFIINYINAAAAAADNEEVQEAFGLEGT